jgi:hypothetical protein
MSDLLDLRFAADPEITHGTRGVVCSRVEEVLRINRLGIYSLTSTTAESSIKVLEYAHRMQQSTPTDSCRTTLLHLILPPRGCRQGEASGHVDIRGFVQCIEFCSQFVLGSP